MTHAAEVARQTWSAVAGCEHDFAAVEDEPIGAGSMVPPQAASGVVGPNLADLCKRCGSSRGRAATIQRHLRYLGRTVPWGGPA